MPAPVMEHTRQSVARPLDRRGERRVEVQWYVRASHPDGGPVKGRIVNISVTGMLLKVPVAYSLGDLVEFEVWLGLAQPIPVVGLVVRRDQCRHGIFYGVEFRGMSDRTRHALADVLLKIRRNEYHDQFAA